MATEIILPALGMAQDTGKIVRWLKAEGDPVKKGEPVVEIETDKATVEIESPAAGYLSGISGAEGEDVPVGQVIARIVDSLSSLEKPSEAKKETFEEVPVTKRTTGLEAVEVSLYNTNVQNGDRSLQGIQASPLAARIASDHNVDLSQVRPMGKRIQKADVLGYLQQQTDASSVQPRLRAASPKARRLAFEQGIDLSGLAGSGPAGAVLAADVLHAPTLPATRTSPEMAAVEEEVNPASTSPAAEISTVWRIMAERTTQSWTTVPHFFLVREVNASRLIAWRDAVLKRSGGAVTYTDLLVKVAAMALREHPHLNASWRDNRIHWNVEINVGLAVAVEQGLVVPVIHRADTLGVREIAARRQELVSKARAGKLRPDDLTGGTFTISNLGMYGIDVFNAIINQPQAAILAVGRIADRVVPLNGQPSVQPVMTLSLSCDHRVVDGARGAQFLAWMAEQMEEPLGLFN